MSHTSMATCNFATDLKPQPDGSVLYAKSCHIQVGKDEEELSLRRDQTSKLQLSLKDRTDGEELQRQRADAWLKTSLEIEKSMQTEKTVTKFEHWFWFVAGGLTMYGASRLNK